MAGVITWCTTAVRHDFIRREFKTVNLGSEQFIEFCKYRNCKVISKFYKLHLYRRILASAVFLNEVQSLNDLLSDFVSLTQI